MKLFHTLTSAFLPRHVALRICIGAIRRVEGDLQFVDVLLELFLDACQFGALTCLRLQLRLEGVDGALVIFACVFEFLLQRESSFLRFYKKYSQR